MIDGPKNVLCPQYVPSIRKCLLAWIHARISVQPKRPQFVFLSSICNASISSGVLGMFGSWASCIPVDGTLFASENTGWFAAGVTATIAPNCVGVLGIDCIGVLGNGVDGNGVDGNGVDGNGVDGNGM